MFSYITNKKILWQVIQLNLPLKKHRLFPFNSKTTNFVLYETHFLICAGITSLKCVFLLLRLQKSSTVFLM